MPVLLSVTAAKGVKTKVADSLIHGRGLFVWVPTVMGPGAEVMQWKPAKKTLKWLNKTPKAIKNKECYYALDADDGRHIYVYPGPKDPLLYVNCSNPGCPEFEACTATVSFRGFLTTTGDVVMSLVVLPRQKIVARKWVEVIGGFAYTQRHDLYPSSRVLTYGNFLEVCGKRNDFYVYETLTVLETSNQWRRGQVAYLEVQQLLVCMPHIIT
jgi:hypothetical protein